MRLVVLSDERITAILRRVLEPGGFEIVHVMTPTAVVTACQEAKPVALVASLSSVADARAQLTAYGVLLGQSAPPALFLLPRATDEEKAQLAAAGAAGVFVNPVVGKQLLATVRDLAARQARPEPPAMAPAPTEEAKDAAEVTARETEPESTPAAPESSLDSIVEQALLSRPSQAYEVSLTGLDDETEEASPQRVWPGPLPEKEEALQLLVARTAGAPVPGSIPESLVLETWKSLSNPESSALEALAGMGSREAAESQRTADLSGIAALRLRLAVAHDQANRLPPTEPVRLDGVLLQSLKQEIDRAIKEVLDPVLNAAVAHGEVDVMKDFRAAREALSSRRQELDRVSARIQGQAEEQQRALLDEAVPEPIQAPRSGMFKTRLLQITTVTAEAARRNAPVLFVALGVVIAVATVLHVFVLDTLHLQGGPDKVEQTTGIANVSKLEYFGTMARATVGNSFDKESDLGALAKQVPAGSTLVVVGEDGMIMETVGPDRLPVLAAAATLSDAGHVTDSAAVPAQAVQ